jgi:hypothetical protein
MCITIEPPVIFQIFTNGLVIFVSGFFLTFRGAVIGTITTRTF